MTSRILHQWQVPASKVGAELSASDSYEHWLQFWSCGCCNNAAVDGLILSITYSREQWKD